MIFDEDLTYTPSGGRWKQYLGGIALPLLVVGYGIFCMVTGKAHIPSRHIFDAVHGEAANWMAIAYFAMAAFSYFHYYWGLHEELCFKAFRMKMLSVTVFILCTGFALYVDSQLNS